MTRFELRVCDVCEQHSAPLPTERHDRDGWTQLDGKDLCPTCSFVLAPARHEPQP